MKKKYNYIPLILFLAISLLFYALKPVNNDFELKLSSSELQLLSGKKLDLLELRGEFYIIHFFASWCGNCKDDFAALDSIKSSINVPIIGIAVNDKLNKLKLLNKARWPYDYIALDIDNTVAKLVRNKAVPETFIINPEGKIAFRHLGSLDRKLVEKHIIPLLKNVE